MAEKVIRAVVDDGTREIPIVNKFGKLICNIYIRPSDISILDRYQRLSEDFSEIIAPLKGVNIKPDGTTDADEEWAAMKVVEDLFKKRLNEVFDMDEADDIFRTRNPFSSVHGKFFAESVLEAIGNLITSSIEEEFEISKKRTDKYLVDLNAEGK